MLHNHSTWCICKIPQYIQSIISVCNIRFAWMFTRLKQFNVTGKTIAWLYTLHITQHQVPVHQFEQSRFLPRVFAITKPLLNIINEPCHFLIQKRLLLASCPETNLHFRRKMIIHYSFIRSLKILSHVIAPS